MASVRERTDRKVIPNWRSYTETVNNGELEYPVQEVSLPRFDIGEYIFNWKDNRNIIFAGELVSAAISNDQLENPDAKDAANYILQKEKESPESLVQVARYLLNRDSGVKDQRQSFILPSKQEKVVYAQIHYLRSITRKYPYNPLTYVEIARLYTMIGQIEQAKNMFDIALHLNNINRYICRSAARFFVHCDDLDRAHYVLRHNLTIEKDPWLIASEISVNLMRGRTSSLIKTASDVINSQDYSQYSLTELQSSLATLELERGTRKKSRVLFERSLQAPDDNSLAQAEWAVQQDVRLPMERVDFSSVAKRYEANALQFYAKEQYKDALNEAVAWINDMPYSRDPIYFGADMAYTYLKDFKSAEDIINYGLIANPNDVGLLNNLAYSYALDDKTKEAEDTLLRIDKVGSILDERSVVCVTATRGLVEFRKNNVEQGRVLYKEAMEEAAKLNDQSYGQKAALNYIREEIIALKAVPTNLSNVLDKIAEDPQDREIKILKEDIFKLVAKYSSKSPKGKDS